MSRHAILNALQEELKSLEEENAMEPAPGSGVQSREVKKEKEPSKVEKKKGFKLTGGGQTVGGEAGGTKNSTVKEEQAIDKADGSSVAADPNARDVDGDDGDQTPTNSGSPEGAEKGAMDKAKGTSVARPTVKDTDGAGSGGTNAKAMNKASGSAVASTGVSENVIELPHDTLVEDADGNQKTLKKGTKVVIGDVKMSESTEMVDIVSSVVSAAVKALNGAGEFDYGLDGKEIQIESLLEDTKKLMEGKPWEDDEEEEEEEIEEEGTYCEEIEDEMGEKDEDGIEDIEEVEHSEYEEKFQDADIDVTDPAAIAGIIADLDDDLDALKIEIGVGDEVEVDEDEEDEALEDEFEDEFDDDGDDENGFEGDEGLGDEDNFDF